MSPKAAPKGKRPVPVPRPVMRLRIWLETEGGVIFGFGRAQLLENIERHGSLKKAAEHMGMSYRAAWGKIKKTEQVLGIRLIAKAGSNKDGSRLTRSARNLMQKFREWSDRVEKNAIKEANRIFSWNLASYGNSLPVPEDETGKENRAK